MQTAYANVRAPPGLPLCIGVMMEESIRLGQPNGHDLSPCCTPAFVSHRIWVIVGCIELYRNTINSNCCQQGCLCYCCPNCMLPSVATRVLLVSRIHGITCPCEHDIYIYSSHAKCHHNHYGHSPYISVVFLGIVLLSQHAAPNQACYAPCSMQPNRALGGHAIPAGAPFAKYVWPWILSHCWTLYHGLPQCASVPSRSILHMGACSLLLACSLLSQRLQ